MWNTCDQLLLPTKELLLYSSLNFQTMHYNDDSQIYETNHTTYWFLRIYLSYFFYKVMTELNSFSNCWFFLVLLVYPFFVCLFFLKNIVYYRFFFRIWFIGILIKAPISQLALRFFQNLLINYKFSEN